MTDEPELHEEPNVPEAAPELDEVEKQSRMWASLCHLAGLCFFLLPPIGLVVGPLVVWILKRHDYAAVDEHGKEAVNFQLSMLICGLISAPLVIVQIGYLMLLVVGVFDLVMIVIASVKASNGQHYRYPVCFRFIK